MKTNKLHSLLLLVALVSVIVGIVSFKSVVPPAPKVVYMQFSTIESIVPGGLGRSKMITVMPDGTKTEEDLQNFYSMVGINFGNISGNNIAITKKINDLVELGWEFDKVITGAQSPTERNAQGIFISRYFFKRNLE